MGNFFLPDLQSLFRPFSQSYLRQNCSFFWVQDVYHCWVLGSYLLFLSNFKKYHGKTNRAGNIITFCWLLYLRSYFFKIYSFWFNSCGDRGNFDNWFLHYRPVWKDKENWHSFHLLHIRFLDCSFFFDIFCWDILFIYLRSELYE